MDKDQYIQHVANMVALPVPDEELKKRIEGYWDARMHPMDAAERLRQLLGVDRRESY